VIDFVRQIRDQDNSEDAEATECFDVSNNADNDNKEKGECFDDSNYFHNLTFAHFLKMDWW
jgi:hypothetical protein